MSTLIVPPVSTSARQDAVELYKAFKGFGCDSAKVIDIIAHRDATQRAFIQQEYKTMYSDELTSRIRSELSGNFEKAVLLWMHDPAGRDATIVRHALSGDVIDLHAATEIICSRTPSQIQTFKQAYHAKFGAFLEHDIQYQAFGDLQKLLLAYVGVIRYEGPEVDHRMVEKDAKDLYKAGERRLGTDEEAFIRIFSERSRAHLAAVASCYKKAHGNSLEKVMHAVNPDPSPPFDVRSVHLTLGPLLQAVKGETSGTFEFALLTILRCAENPAQYFAKLLRKAMKGLGTNDTALIRTVVTRTEIDMQYIKAEYQKKYGKTLRDAIHSETSGHYRNFLLSLVGPGGH